MSNTAGDLLFGRVAVGLFELVWNYKIVGGKLLFVQAHQLKHASLNCFQAREQFSVLPGSWVLSKATVCGSLDRRYVGLANVGR